jgi:putative membrane protein
MSEEAGQEFRATVSPQNIILLLCARGNDVGIFFVPQRATANGFLRHRGSIEFLPSLEAICGQPVACRSAHGGLQLTANYWGSHNMNWIANVLVALVAVLHVYFMVLEMFLWTKPLGLKTFRHSPEKAEDSAVLAANQGLYNGFLAAGLIWGLVHPVAGFGFQIKGFFLLCVIVGGIYGAATVSRRILFVQAAPAVLALIALWLAVS